MTQSWANGQRAAEREVALQLTLDGYSIQRLPNGKKGKDLLAENDRERFFVEVERRDDFWKSGPFPRNTIHIPERRIAKWTDDTLQFVCRRDLALAHVVFPQSIRNLALEEVPNCYVEHGELMANVPIGQTLPYPLMQSRNLGPIWEMNRNRIRLLVTNIKGLADYRELQVSLGDMAPYGMAIDEWRILWTEAEEAWRKRMTCDHNLVVYEECGRRKQKCSLCGRFYGYLR